MHTYVSVPTRINNMNSSNEPNELSQCFCRDHSTVNVVMSITVALFPTMAKQ